MPIYTYVTIEPDGSEGEVFEVEQSIKSPVLTRHPENGKPVKRVYESPNINDEYTPGKEKSLSDITRIKKPDLKSLKRTKFREATTSFDCASASGETLVPCCAP